jgi:hypothetical protein
LKLARNAPARWIAPASQRVADAAASESRTILTVDRGFGDVRTYPPGTHPGNLVVHARDLGQDITFKLLNIFLLQHDVIHRMQRSHRARFCPDPQSPFPALDSAGPAIGAVLARLRACGAVREVRDHRRVPELLATAARGQVGGRRPSERASSER